MKNIVKLLSMISLVILLSLNLLSAQKGSCGWGQNSKYGGMYDPSTVTTLTATVENVERIVPEKGMAYGLHLMVKTEKNEAISVHLGPVWYLDNQDVQIVKGDTISITGSKIVYQNAPAIIAAEIEKGHMVLYLRDKDGFPAWNGWRKKGKNQCCKGTGGTW